MIALFFEVMPRDGQDDRYLEIAGALRPELERSGGVAFLDRFRSLTRPRVLLSHQIWVDEASLARWRANGRHHGAQTAGRTAVFEDYRLRVGPVVAAMGDDRRVALNPVGISYNDPSMKPERFVAVVRSRGQAFSASLSGETWRSVYDETSFAWVGAVASLTEGQGLIGSAADDVSVVAAQVCLVSRDYGMFDRAEAPQYFPPAA